MTLEDLVEAHLAGEKPDVPGALRDEFKRAVTAHEAIQYALGETILIPGDVPDDRPPPTLPGDYEIVRELGRGGMGVVYLARQKSPGRQIAVKVLRPGELTFGPLVKRFMEEARYLARLRHPNIVSIHEIGRADGEPYFTMDYVQGESLSAILTRERLSPSRTLALWNQAAEAVQHAHAQGIIHRDLKPGNILVDADGHAYVSDFGLARDMSQASDLTRSGEVMGTPSYMAPEQARGQAELIGEATDVHALGAILYEMLTGRPPYGCDSPASVLVRLLKEEPVPPRKIDRRIPRDLETICSKAMAKDPHRRYSTVRALLEDVRRFESGRPVMARRPGPIHRAARFLCRQWKIVTAVTLTVAVSVAILLLLAPRLFDKTTEELVAWAEEHHQAGEHQQAVRVYRRALRKATGPQRREILAKMVCCCGEIGDAKGAVDAALLIVEEDPSVSFGKYDYLVAQALVARMHSEWPTWAFGIREEDRPIMEMTAKRLRVFLRGPHGTDAQRRQAELTSNLIAKRLANEPLQAILGKPPAERPKGTVEELLTRAEDETLGSWERGKAAYVAGLALEKSGQREKSLAALRQAYIQMKSAYPIYKGLRRGMPASTKREDREVSVPPESQLIEEVFQSVRRLDPEAPNSLSGELRFRFVGVDVPPDVAIWPTLALWDPAIAKSGSGYNRNLARTIPVKLDQAATVGVADGRYRITMRFGGKTWEPSAKAARFARLMEVDFGALPEEVEIYGNTRELKIPVRLLQQIDLLGPPDGAAVDLQKEFFRWSKVDGAAYYHVIFTVTYISEQPELPGRLSSTGNRPVKVSSPALCLGTFPAEKLGEVKSYVGKLPSYLVAGSAGDWNVEAFDSEGRPVGRSLEHKRTFVVARGLNEP